jgi:hypothetical protein
MFKADPYQPKKYEEAAKAAEVPKPTEAVEGGLPISVPSNSQGAVFIDNTAYDYTAPAPVVAKDPYLNSAYTKDQAWLGEQHSMTKEVPGTITTESAAKAFEAYTGLPWDPAMKAVLGNLESRNRFKGAKDVYSKTAQEWITQGKVYVGSLREDLPLNMQYKLSTQLAAIKEARTQKTQMESIAEHTHPRRFDNTTLVVLAVLAVLGFFLYRSRE